MEKKWTFLINKENDFKFCLHRKKELKEKKRKVLFKNIIKIAAFFENSLPVILLNPKIFGLYQLSFFLVLIEKS
jgi:hypothetical protein